MGILSFSGAAMPQILASLEVFGENVHGHSNDGDQRRVQGRVKKDVEATGQS